MLRPKALEGTVSLHREFVVSRRGMIDAVRVSTAPHQEFEGSVSFKGNLVYSSTRETPPVSLFSPTQDSSVGLFFYYNVDF